MRLIVLIAIFLGGCNLPIFNGPLAKQAQEICWAIQDQEGGNLLYRYGSECNCHDTQGKPEDHTHPEAADCVIYTEFTMPGGDHFQVNLAQAAEHQNLATWQEVVGATRPVYHDGSMIKLMDSIGDDKWWVHYMASEPLDMGDHSQFRLESTEAVGETNVYCQIKMCRSNYD